MGIKTYRYDEENDSLILVDDGSVFGWPMDIAPKDMRQRHVTNPGLQRVHKGNGYVIYDYGPGNVYIWEHIAPVTKEEFDMKRDGRTLSMWFIHSDGEEEKIAEGINDIQTAISVALGDAKKRNPEFKSYYQRISELIDDADGWAYDIDVGSWSESYRLKWEQNE